MAGEDNITHQTHQTRRTLKGILIMLGLLGGALFVFFLEDILGAFERRYTIVALVPDAPDISRGTPVWVGGKAVGAVTTVAILPSSVDTMGRVAVTLELPRHVQPQVRTDSRVRLTSISMISENAIDILPGSAAARQLVDGDTLRTDPRPTAAQLTARAAIVRSELDTVLAAVRTLAPIAAARMEDTRRAFAGMDAAMAEAQRLRTDLQANPGLALLRDPAFQASLERTRGYATELPATIAQLRERVGEAGEIGPALARLQARADTLSAQLTAAAAMLEAGEGTLGRMQHDTALVRAVNAARASLDSLVAEVRNNPLRFVF
jgi:phospholipid/cholesterol/gamma-HCH transport system substrate-binding protein